MGAAGSGRGKRRRRRALPFVHEVRRIDAYQLFSKTCPVEKMSCFVMHGYIFEKASYETYQIERHGILLGSLKVAKVDCMPYVARYLFKCPNCGSRRRFLSVSPSAIACRRCLNLAYKSQNATLSQRLISKAKQLGNKLQAVIMPKFKLKGMHRTTYQNLVEAWYECDQLSTLAFLNSDKSLSILRKHAESLSVSPLELFQEAIQTKQCHLTEKILREKYQI